MPVAVELPSLGESVVEGTVSRWLVKEGDRVTVLLQRGPQSLYVAYTVGRG